MGEQGFRPNSVDVLVGYNVRTKRTKLGLSWSHMAEQLGLTLAQYQECESGMRRFGAARLLKLARLIDVNPQYFLEALTVGGRIEFSKTKRAWGKRLIARWVELTPLRNSQRAASRVLNGRGKSLALQL
jgi:transcriptional regulator with XRE-family HTH domain